MGSARILPIARLLALLLAVLLPFSAGSAGGTNGGAFRAAMEEAPLAPKVAPKDYDVTITMYFDYQCTYCKAQHLALMELLRGDTKVRLVYRDWPIFGGSSVRAARLAIASQYQGRHAAFHDALMRAGPLDEAALKAAARLARVDWARLEADVKAHSTEIDALMHESRDQADALELTGTPGMVIGRTIVPGALKLDGLRAAVRRARTG